MGLLSILGGLAGIGLGAKIINDHQVKKDVASGKFVKKGNKAVPIESAHLYDNKGHYIGKDKLPPRRKNYSGFNDYEV